MDTSELFSRQVTFDCLIGYIGDMADLDNRYRFRIKKAKMIIGGVVNGLKSLIKKEGGYYFAEDLKEIIESSGYNISALSELQFKELITKFTGALHTLDELEENPKEAYRKKEELSGLEKICNLMGDIYRLKQMHSPVQQE